MIEFQCVNCPKELKQRSCGCTTSCSGCKTQYRIDMKGNVTVSDTKEYVPSIDK
jgi:hypothetical protein